MSEFEWTFGAGNSINVKRTDNVSSCAHFSYDDKLRFHIVWTTGCLCQAEWDMVLTCVKEAKTVLKRLKRL